MDPSIAVTPVSGKVLFGSRLPRRWRHCRVSGVAPDRLIFPSERAGVADEDTMGVRADSA
jgi:hypothetical protein